MLTAALRDLQFRRRRFAIATLGAALVFGLSVTLSGLAASFDREAERTIELFGAEGWVIDTNAAGPFSGSSRIPTAAVDAVAQADGVDDAGGLLLAPTTARDPLKPDLVNVFGVQIGRLGAPEALTRADEIVLDRQLGHEVGDQFLLGDRRFRVVGLVDSSMFAGVPNVYLDLRVVQEMAFAGQDLVSVVLIDGDPGDLPALRTVSSEDAIDNALLPLSSAKSTIAMVRTVLWIIAALVIGSVLYLNAQERTRDFAVFKATGATTASIVIGLAVQAIAIAVVASILAVILSFVLAPVMPLAVETPASTYLLLPIVVLVVSLLGSIGGARRAASVPPAEAFGG